MEIEALRTQIKQIIDSKAVSQADIARKSGLSDGAISLFKNGKYGANEANIAEQLEKWLTHYLESKARSLSIPEMGWVETPTARQIMDVISYAQYGHHINTIYGEPGIGKTMAIERYCQDHSSTAVLITASPSLPNTLGIYLEIARALGMNGLPRRIAIVRDELIGYFLAKQSPSGNNADKSNGVVIVDEAQHVPDSAIEAMRVDLYDIAKVALVFCGNDDVVARLKKKSTASYFARFTSRTAINHEPKVTPEDLSAILEGWEIKGNQYYNILEPALYTDGRLRTVSKVLENAFAVVDGQGRTELSPDILKKAWLNRGKI